MKPAARILRLVADEALKTIRRPARVMNLLNPSVRDALRVRAVVRDAWKSDGQTRRREYRGYEDYVAHQKLKLGSLDLSVYDERFRRALGDRLRQEGVVRPGMTALCLAARIGTEVRAFIDVGCFAVGIDLNPGPGNRFVVHGDFHALQFADGSCDVVFTNSLDHAFDIEKILSEVHRVLGPGGLLLVEACGGAGAGMNPRFFESFWWERIEDLTAIIGRGGFALEGKREFDYPWPGSHLIFRRT